MAQNCEICENNEIKYLPYPIENEIYINITCFFVKKEYQYVAYVRNITMEKIWMTSI